MVDNDRKPIKVDVSRSALGLSEKANDESTREVKPVAKGTVAESNVATKAVHRFFGGSPRDAAEHVFDNIILPMLKDLLFDTISGGTARLVYGDQAPANVRRPSFGGNPSYNNGGRNYGGYFNGDNRRTISSRERAHHDFSNIKFERRDDVEAILAELNSLIDRYGYARVSDFYDLASVSREWTDNSWGWRSMVGSRVRSVYGGFVADLPEPERLQL